MNQATHDDITRLLSDNYVAVPPVDQRRLELQLVQHRPWQDQESELVLFNGHYLAIRDRRHPDLPERIVNLAYLNAQPSYQPGNLQLRLWSGTAALLLVLAATIVMAPQSVLLVSLAALSLLLLMLMSARPGRWVFSTALGAVPVCEVSRSLLQHGKTKQFVSLIIERAEGAKAVLPTGSKRLAAELAEHRRMLESGSLSRRHYESARQRLLVHVRRGGAQGDNAPHGSGARSKMQLA